jgi:heat shock protein HtpX
MDRSPTLAVRALLAIALLIGFYVLAIGVAFGLLYLPYAEWRLTGRIHVRLTLFCVVGALLILWSLLPRVDRFQAPGPALREEDHPRLFRLLETVAEATDQAMPAEIYLALDMNAWVAQRGGIMALGSRHVMSLGLPLLQLLSTSQLAAVLAHEFGHYYGGDTSLGPLVYKTRAAIGRTLENLAEHSTLLMKPFEWYGDLFLRITHAISRQQEHSADMLAARTVGVAPLVEGLKALHAGSVAFESYWKSEVVPALSSGYRPPITRGFGEFLTAPAVSAGIKAVMEAQQEPHVRNPYDTHPPLNDRIAALQEIRVELSWEDDSPAISLLDGIDALEPKLLAAMAGSDAAEQLTPLASDEVVTHVWIPAWRLHADKNRERFKGITPASLADLANHPAALAVALRIAARPEVATEGHRQDASAALGAVLALALLARNWTPTGRPGQSLVLERGTLRIQPFELWEQLVAGRVSAAAWRDTCAKAGIGEIELGSPAETDTSSTRDLGAAT